MENTKGSTRKMLPKREQAVGKRLKLAREHLRLTQAEFADQVGINRQRLASYEELRAPVRFDLALKICRQFVLSEKWLATGQGDMRQCFDLNSRGATYHVPIDTPYGEAYDSHLGDLYEKIREETGDATQFVFRETDNFDFIHNWFTYLLDCWIKELPKTNPVPKDFANGLCAFLAAQGFQFVDFVLEHQKIPTDEDFLKKWDEVAKKKTASASGDKAQKKHKN